MFDLFTTALLDATNNWAYNINRGTVVFLDLEKAFDKVDHEILLCKLSIHGESLEWFKSYGYLTIGLLVVV